MDFVRNFVFAAALAGAAAVCLASCTGGGSVIIIDGGSSSQSSSSSSSESSSSSSEVPNPDPNELEWKTGSKADGTVIVTGCTVSGASVYGEISIPDKINGCTVSEIGERAFYGQSNLTKITMPDSVEKIGKEAFQGCTNLKAVDFSANMKEIGGHAFAECANLEKIDLPDAMRSIGALAFTHCTSLQQAVIRDNAYGVALTIDAYAFEGCTALKKIYLPRNLEKLNDLFTSGVKLDALYYGGSEEDWNKLAAGGNAPQAAKIYYLASPEDMNDDSGDDPSSSSSSSSSEDRNTNPAAYPSQMLALINAERAKAGLSQLKMENTSLTAAAQKRAEEQAERSGHTRPNGKSYETVLGEYGVTGFTAKAEAIEKTGYTVPTSVVNGWMNTTERANLLNEQFTEMGVGYYESEETNQCYWVVLFVGYGT